MDTAKRIFKLLAESGMEQKELAKKIGVVPQTITDWKNQKSKSYTKYLPQIAEALGTNTEYLLTGSTSRNVEQWPIPKSACDIPEDVIKAAFFEGAEDLSPEEMEALWDDARDYMRYKLEQRRRQQK